jgi:8-oxo-dGTP diphosphatase
LRRWWSGREPCSWFVTRNRTGTLTGYCQEADSRKGRHTVDVVARMALEGDEEATLGSDPEVEPGTEPTLREIRWVSVDELRKIELLPASVKERLLRDAGGGWTPADVYLGSADA